MVKLFHKLRLETFVEMPAFCCHWYSGIAEQEAVFPPFEEAIKLEMISDWHFRIMDIDVRIVFQIVLHVKCRIAFPFAILSSSVCFFKKPDRMLGMQIHWQCSRGCCYGSIGSIFEGK